MSGFHWDHPFKNMYHFMPSKHNTDNKNVLGTTYRREENTTKVEPETGRIIDYLV